MRLSAELPIIGMDTAKTSSNFTSSIRKPARSSARSPSAIAWLLFCKSPLALLRWKPVAVRITGPGHQLLKATT